MKAGTVYAAVAEFGFRISGTFFSVRGNAA
jgi:hypothetical protein